MPSAAARPSARYRSVVVVLLLAFILLGIFSLGRLPVDLPPSGEAPRLNLHVSAPGLIAPVLEERLTQQLERTLAGVPGVAGMDSITSSGEVGIDLSLHHRRDIERVQRDVMARLEQAAASWPGSVDAPTLALTDGASKVAEFTLTSGTRDALALRDWAEAEFAKRLRELPGVAAVDIEGGTVREILVLPDQRRLAGYGLSFEDLLQAIRKNPEADSQARAAPVKGRSRREPVQSGNLAALAALPVMLPGGESIHLSEVAGLTLSQEPGPALLWVDGAEAVRVKVAKQPRAALSEVAEEVRAHVDWMRANRLIPEGIEIHSFVSQLDAARKPLRKMAYAFLIGFVLVLAAVHLLWGSGRRTLMFGVILIAALQAVFIVMALSGAALDAMTLGGVVLGTGLFGGAVMLLFGSTTPPAPAPVPSVNPVIAATVAMMMALVPVWFTGGELGAVYREPVSVFAGAWLLAALLALWLVPMFDTRRRRQASTSWQVTVRHAVTGMHRYYDALLRRLLQRAVPALGVAALVLTALTAAVFMKSRELSAPVELPGREIVWRLQGPDSARLRTLADDVVQRLRALPGLHQASHSGQVTREEWLPRLDEERARELGVDLGLAGKALAIAATGIPAGSFRDADRRYNVRMRLSSEDAAGIAAGNILLLGELEHRPAVYLRDIATLERVVVPARIHRHNGTPEIRITALLADTRSPDRLMTETDRLLDKMKLPSGYQLMHGRGSDAARNDSGIMAFLLAVLLVFAAQTVLHRSLRLALPITLAAGATVVGTGAVLLLSGVPWSPPLWLGALMLFGIAAGHAAALAAARETRHLRQIARHQFRPLCAMVLTAALGMLALMWVNGSVSGLHILITVLLTGLPISLLINLLLTPLLYWMFLRQEQTPVSRRL
ncbi:acriflavin resistance protein [Sulfuricaulis limicola]|uniref:Acriflavin resistance protein n=1 Tax=Sulfuricaulis limicola TaxID=1620215 RepID=A0A1B4XEV2_9GAMM|nr:efflux RND transporter permease subunit [Sulfuricaulis limicola]BAV33330.1 acriflavin resistance protein [Sulfuricaulis limicola]